MMLYYQNGRSSQRAREHNLQGWSLHQSFFQYDNYTIAVYFLSRLYDPMLIIDQVDDMWIIYHNELPPIDELS